MPCHEERAFTEVKDLPSWVEMSIISILPVHLASRSDILKPCLPFSSKLAPALTVILRRRCERHDDQVTSKDVGVRLFRSCCQ